MFAGNADQLHLQFAKSVAYGIVNPIITDCKGLVIDGERRVKALLAKEVAEKAPCWSLDEPLTINEAIFFRILLNPGKNASLWAKESLGGSPFAWIDRDDDFVRYSSLFAIQRASETIENRAKRDLALQNMLKRYDATLLETAKHCVNAVRCLQSIGLNCVGGLTPNLNKAKGLIENAIQEIVNVS